MLSGLGTITITDENYSEHVAFELGERDGLLFGGRNLAARFIFDIFHSGRVHGPAMGASEGAPVAEQVQVLADGLWGNLEGLDQLLDRDPTLLSGEFNDLGLAHRGIHEGSAAFGL